MYFCDFCKIFICFKKMNYLLPVMALQKRGPGARKVREGHHFVFQSKAISKNKSMSWSRDVQPAAHLMFLCGPLLNQIFRSYMFLSVSNSMSLLS